MSIIGRILIGLIAGTIAKAIMPGDNEPSGWIATIILGIVGALLGGWLGKVIFNIPDVKSFFSLKTWIIAVLGSCLALFIYGFFTNKKK